MKNKHEHSSSAHDPHIIKYVRKAEIRACFIKKCYMELKV